MRTGKLYVVVKKHSDLPGWVKRQLNKMGKKWDHFEEVKELYWGAYLFQFNKNESFSFKPKTFGKSHVSRINYDGDSISMYLEEDYI